MSEPAIRVLSLGAGVQSTTLALLSAEGRLPKLDAAIFADTGWEPQTVYDHLSQLERVLAGAGIACYRAQQGDLRAEALDAAHRFVSIPLHVRTPAGRAMGQRQCTSQYKLRPIRRKVRELLGAASPDFLRVPKGRVCELWIGFSTDEIERVSDNGVPGYLQQRYPLLDLGMDRGDCLRWLRSRGWTSVAKSACIGCPYNGNRRWRELRDNYPAEWADVVAFDEAIRHPPGMPASYTGFLHRSLLPLTVAPVDRVTSAEWKTRQGDLLDVIADAELEDGDPDGCSPFGCRSGRTVP
jgi:hypothetical protein